MIEFKFLWNEFKEGFFGAIRTPSEFPLVTVVFAALFLLFMVLISALATVIALYALIYGVPHTVSPADFWSQLLPRLVFFYLCSFGFFWIMRKFWRLAKVKHPSLATPHK